jgi:Tol biopolymer transport system component/putative hemolysin
MGYEHTTRERATKTQEILPEESSEPAPGEETISPPGIPVVPDYIIETVCVFPDGNECEEWDFLSGRCGQEYSFCAQQGYLLEAGDNMAICLFPDGSSCLEFDYFNGDCGPSEITSPESGEVLPAPVIYLGVSDEAAAPGHQDIWRLEMDGKTITQITHEAVPVTGFAVSPEDDSIAYITLTENDLVRINADGGGKTLLIDGSDLSVLPEEGPVRQLSNPAWSPDGTQIAFGLGGINLLPATGGEPNLILANEPGPEGSRQWARSFYPLSWSPDGAKLLIGDVVGGGLSIINVADGSVIEILNPSGDFYCCSPTWSIDGQYIYFGGVLYDPSIFQAPGLWRIDVNSGEAEVLIPGYEDPGAAQEGGAPMTLIQSAQQLSDGNVYAFTASGSYEELWHDEAGNLTSPLLEMNRLAPDGSQPSALRSDADQFGDKSWTFGDALWAADASGAVTNILGSEVLPTAKLLWLPADGSDGVILEGRGFQYQWGK